MFGILSGQNSPEAGSQRVIPPLLTCSTWPAVSKTAILVDAGTQVATTDAAIQTVQKVTEPVIHNTATSVASTTQVPMTDAAVQTNTSTSSVPQRVFSVHLSCGNDTASASSQTTSKPWQRYKRLQKINKGIDVVQSHGSAKAKYPVEVRT